MIHRQNQTPPPVLLLALTASALLLLVGALGVATREADAGYSTVPATRVSEQQAEQSVGALTAMLREQASRTLQRSGTATPEAPSFAITTEAPWARSSEEVTTGSTPQQQQEITTLRPSGSQTTTTASSSSSIATTGLLQSFQYMKPVRAARCQHLNNSYAIGQKWNDDCLQTCECVAGDEQAQIAINACRPRCPIYNDPPGAGCSLQRSKMDECCLDWVCETDAKLAPPLTTLMNTADGQINFRTTEIKLPSARQQQQQASASTMTATTTTLAATPAPTTVTKMNTVTSSPPTQTQQQQQKKVPTTTTKQQVPNTSPVPSTPTQPPARRPAPVTTTRPPESPPPTTANQQPSTTMPPAVVPAASFNRVPKQVLVVSAPQMEATQSHSGLPPQPPQSLVTTTTVTAPATAAVNQTATATTSREFNQRMLSPTPAASGGSAANFDGVESRQNNVVFPSVMPQTVTVPAAATTTTTTTTQSPFSEDEIDANDQDLCIVSMESPAYNVNQTWLEEPCNQSCRCVFSSEPRDPSIDVIIESTINLKVNSGQTEIRCSLPPHCASLALRLRPTADCPSPRLLAPPQSNKQCACPTVICPKPAAQTVSKPVPAASSLPIIISTTAATPAAATTRSQPPPSSSGSGISGCQLKENAGRVLNFGETFNDECHSTCKCFEDGKIRCQQLTCPKPPQGGGCAEWEPEANFKPNSSESQCCPQFVCKDNAATPISSPPMQIMAFKSCLILGREVLHGERVPEEMHPSNPGCEKVCSCNDGNIICQPLCPLLSDLPPEDLACPLDQARRVQTSDECCPKWLCQISEEYALQAFDVTPLNATSVEVGLLLPLFAVGRQGKAELNYTGLASVSMANGNGGSDLPPANAHWTRKSNIRTADGIFSSQSVKYHLHNLKPNHMYWFKLLVHFNDTEKPFNEPLESQLQRVVMPALGAAAEPNEEPPIRVGLEQAGVTSTTAPTTTSTTSTTTPMPTILLQPAHIHQTKPTNSNHTHHHQPPTSVAPAIVSSSTTPRSASSSVAPMAPTSTTTSTTTTSTTTTTTASPAVATSEQSSSPAEQSLDGGIAGGASSSLPAEPSTTTATSTTTSSQKPAINAGNETGGIDKPDLSVRDQSPPCLTPNQISGDPADDQQPMAWTDQIQSQMNIPLQRYAWHLLVALSIMTVLFTIVTCLYVKRCSRVVAPITSSSGYDNSSFTRLMSFHPPPKHVLLQAEENNQNYNNMARQKNLEVDQTSPLHNGRQLLI